MFPRKGSMIAAAAGVCFGWAAPAQAHQCDPQELVKLVASDATVNDQFGYSVAVSGDTAVIGASLDDYGEGTDTGSAYVFVRSGGVWTEQAKLTASDASANDRFGVAVALSGDTIVIGASRDDHEGGTDAGSAYVFVRSGGEWTEQAKLTAPDAAAYDHFGSSVALSGDTAVIGAPYDDHAGGDYAGSAYVFVRSGGEWTEPVKLTASDAAANDEFGWSVALSGDTTVIGARFDCHAGGTAAGSAYVFVRSDGVWTEEAKLTASDAAAYDEFGWSVALSDDTAVIGARFDCHEGGTNAGSAYVFVRSDGVWTEQAKLTASDTATNDQFGWSVALSGDTAVIGAGGDDHAGGTDAGSAYVFVRSGPGAPGWTEEAKLAASDAEANDQFGCSVALSGDTAVIGAPKDDHAGGADAGSAYVFDLNCSPPPSSIIAWRSVRIHDAGQLYGGPYECAIVLDHTVDSGCATTEPRSGGVQRIEVDFDAVVTVAGIVEAQNLTDGGTIPADNAYVRHNDDGTSTLIVEFDAGTLPEMKCYKIDLAESIPGITGDTDCRMIALEGDADGDCNVTLNDALLIKDENGSVSGCEDARWDLDVDWNITLNDALRAKDLNGNAVTCP